MKKLNIEILHNFTIIFFRAVFFFFMGGGDVEIGEKVLGSGKKMVVFFPPLDPEGGLGVFHRFSSKKVVVFFMICFLETKEKWIQLG